MRFPEASAAQEIAAHPLVDELGEIVGSIFAFYADPTGQWLEWAEVHTGIIHGRRHLVPLADALVGETMVEVGYAKEHVLRAPTVGDDEEAELTPMEERVLYDHYGLPWEDETEGAGSAPGDPDGSVRIDVHPPSLLKRLAWG